MGKRIAMVGCGAIGSYVGGHMTRAGHDVTMIDMWPEHVDYIRTKGLELTGLTPAESVTVKCNAVHISEVQNLSKQAPIDIAFIAVKSYDTQWAAQMIKPYLSPGGFAVSLQNCVNEERLAEVVGWGKTVGTVISLLGVVFFEPGRVKRTVPLGGEKHLVFRTGEVHGGITQRIDEVTEILTSCDSAKSTDNLWGERWSKLCINSMRNALSAVTGFGGNDRDINEMTRSISIRLGGQGVRVGEAMGFKLEDMLHMDPQTLARAGEGDKAAYAEISTILVDAAHKRAGENRPSMGQDIMKGRRTETDYINGYIAVKGEEAGVPAPLHAKMNELVHKVERGEIVASPDNVKGL